VAEIRALLVEDSTVHQRLLVEGFKAVGQPVRLDIHPNAESALEAVERMRFQSPAEWPHFAIIDVNLPGMSGIELADRIRHMRHFDGWPLVMLTASPDPEDRTESLLAHATGYFLKPTTGDGYIQLVRDILRFIISGADASAPKKGERPKATHRGSAEPN
jgi:CheY-like chemotaxis protein